jgi:threonine/homoserine/homoserine lactone efflux protein
MSAEKIIKTGIGAILLFFILSTLVSVFVTVLSFIFTFVFAALFVGLAVYLTSFLVQYITNESNRQKSRENSMSKEERIERLKKDYMDGKITESQLDRKLDLEFGGPDEEFVRDTDKDKSREYF